MLYTPIAWAGPEGYYGWCYQKPPKRSLSTRMDAQLPSSHARDQYKSGPMPFQTQVWILTEKDPDNLFYLMPSEAVCTTTFCTITLSQNGEIDTRQKLCRIVRSSNGFWRKGQTKVSLRGKEMISSLKEELTIDRTHSYTLGHFQSQEGINLKSRWLNSQFEAFSPFPQVQQVQTIPNNQARLHHRHLLWSCSKASIQLQANWSNFI